MFSPSLNRLVNDDILLLDDSISGIIISQLFSTVIKFNDLAWNYKIYTVYSRESINILFFEYNNSYHI